MTRALDTVQMCVFLHFLTRVTAMRLFCLVTVPNTPRHLDEDTHPNHRRLGTPSQVIPEALTALAVSAHHICLHFLTCMRHTRLFCSVAALNNHCQKHRQNVLHLCSTESFHYAFKKRRKKDVLVWSLFCSPYRLPYCKYELQL